MSQARLAVRNYLPKANKMSAIDQLDVPLILRNYLKHVTWDDLTGLNKGEMNGEWRLCLSMEKQYVWCVNYEFYMRCWTDEHDSFFYLIFFHFSFLFLIFFWKTTTALNEQRGEETKKMIENAHPEWIRYTTDYFGVSTESIFINYDVLIFICVFIFERMWRKHDIFLAQPVTFL